MIYIVPQKILRAIQKITSSKRLKLVKYSGFILSMCGLYFALQQSNLSNYYNSLFDISLTTQALIFTFLITSTIFFSEGWRLLLKKNGVFQRRIDVFFSIAKFNLGKYIPGNFWHYALRHFDLYENNNDRKKTLILSIEEIILVLVTISVIALLSFAYHLELFLLFAVLVSSTIIGLFLVRRRPLFPPSLAYSLFALLQSAGFAVVLLGIDAFGSNQFSISKVLYCFCLAWIAGLIMPGSPGGIGVREWVALVLIDNIQTAPVLAQALITFRLYCILTEIFLFMILFTIRRLTAFRTTQS